MRTVIVQGLEELPDGSRRPIEVQLKIYDRGPWAGKVEAEVVSEANVLTGTGIG